MDTIKVGSNIDAWCTKCKLVLAHTIEAVADGAIKRVQCNTCHGRHQFRASEPGVKKVTLGIRPKAAPKSKSKISDYAKLLSGKNLSSALPYDARRQFVKGELVQHPVFGLGVVVEAKDVSKIEVLFEGGPKILIHGRV